MIAAGRDPSPVVKSCLAWWAMASGAEAKARRAHARALRILMYHGVVEHLEGPAAFGDLFIEQDMLDLQMRHLARHFQPVPLEQAVASLRAQQPLPDRAVAVTFDDGYRSTITHAMPVLRRHRIPAGVFVPSEQAGRGGMGWFDALRVAVHEAWLERQSVLLGQDFTVDGASIRNPADRYRQFLIEIDGLPSIRRKPVVEALEQLGRSRRVVSRYPELTVAGWDEWRRATADGWLTIGSHGLRHGDLTTMTPEECAEDLCRSRQQIEAELSRPCLSLAYPYGRCSPEILEAAQRAGYACALTTEDGLNTDADDPFALRRTMIGDQGSYWLFRARVSGAWQRWRQASAREATSAPTLVTHAAQR